MPVEFDAQFHALTGNAPFPWQRRLYEKFVAGDIPKSCNLPTGLGKTSVIAVWLLARQANAKLPRRLVYVVNRRTVVDQTTDEVEKYLLVLEKERKLPGHDRLAKMSDADNREWEEANGKLQKSREVMAETGFRYDGLALSTLRGQFADNRAWSADPSKPAVICGTVDMIGSRLLFGGYGLGFKTRPLHAGFLGQDALLVHDEAHLEPAFQELLLSIEREQERCNDFGRLRVMELTATSRGGAEKPFGLADADYKDAEVILRTKAAKKVCLHLERDPKKLAEQVAELALRHNDSGRAVLVFVRKVDDVLKVRELLKKQKVQTLTGTLRGKERDALAESDPIFARFQRKPPDWAETGTVYLVCTSAGEVGVNISADHLVCDLSTFESMAQRFGRVNRFGARTDTVIDVVHPKEFDADKPVEQRRERTLDLLTELPALGEGRNGSPEAMGNLDAARRLAAFTPTPTILPATDMLFDAWALTSIREKLPGRPAVEAYLHGVAEWEPAQTQVAWRAEVGVITGDLLAEHEPKDLLDDYPLKPHELLREPSYRAFVQFAAMAKRCGESPAWLLDDFGKVEVVTVADLADKDKKERINRKTVILPPSAGGLKGGLLDGAAAPEDAMDVADIVNGEEKSSRRRLWSDDDEYDAKTKGMHLIRDIEFAASQDDEGEPGRSWDWFETKNEGGRTAKFPVLWRVHVGDVEREADAILNNLNLPEELDVAVRVAASLHDHGKRRKVFQHVLGNWDYPNVVIAKSGRRGGRTSELYRHEFGSLTDAEAEASFRALSADQQDLVRHLIASHHGYARPHFPADRAFDPDAPDSRALEIASEVPARFARLQRRHGRWGLAYLESLLRAADWAASGNPSKPAEGQS